MWGVIGILLVCLGCGRVQFELRSDADNGLVDGATGDANDTRTDWWDGGWSRRIKLVVDNSGPALFNFPLLVKMNPSRIAYGDALPTGADLRFVAADQTTLLPFDIERWGSGDSFVWVRTNIPETGTVIYLYYGNPSAPSAASAFSTWAGHSLVWHMAQIPTGLGNDIADSSPNNNRGSTQGGMPAGAQATGMVGGSLTFDGTDDWITAATSTSLLLTGALTIQMWINITTARNQWLCDHTVPTTEQETGNHLYEWSIQGNDTLELQWEYGAGNDETPQSTVAISSPPGTWTLLGLTRNLSTNSVTFYQNGAPLGSIVGFANAATGGTAGNFFLGGENDTTTSKLPFAGRIDEVRILNEPHTPAWMAADYRSMTDQLITYNAPEMF